MEIKVSKFQNIASSVVSSRCPMTWKVVSVRVYQFETWRQLEGRSWWLTSSEASRYVNWYGISCLLVEKQRKQKAGLWLLRFISTAI
jgi:hypothetical protein